MKAKDVLISGITGTSFMTLFSYLLSEATDKNYKEPNLLGKLIDNLIPGEEEEVTQIEGWLSHYAVGILFALVYVKLWEDKKIKPSLKNGLLLGAASGALAMLVWKFTFKAHPFPPKTDFKNYYAQLMPAHIVFAVFATLGYKLAKRMENKNVKYRLRKHW
ncbi:hypothetical protein BH09BAC6_BH09BAC6_10300 [soil metagenome]|jgi:glucan phosphoethanolaminetransferase (alkaline phosphatase superfamily)